MCDFADCMSNTALLRNLTSINSFKKMIDIFLKCGDEFIQ